MYKFERNFFKNEKNLFLIAIKTIKDLFKTVTDNAALHFCIPAKNHVADFSGKFNFVQKKYVKISFTVSYPNEQQNERKCGKNGKNARLKRAWNIDDVAQSTDVSQQIESLADRFHRLRRRSFSLHVPAIPLSVL